MIFGGFIESSIGRSRWWQRRRACSARRRVARRWRPTRGGRALAGHSAGRRRATTRAVAAMPALRLPEQAFTVINHEERSPRALARARSVNVVRPLPRDAPLDPHFTRALDYKLRRLKRKEMQQAASRRPRAHHASEPDVAREHAAPAKAASRSYPHLDALARDKPRFVTTVKSGQFLLPPPPLARLLGLQSLYPAPPARERVVYEYANRPEPVASRARRPAAAAARVGDAFRGVRALVAGVAGVRQQLERRDHVLVPTASLSRALLSIHRQLA